jgi:hypothetical protein
MLDAIAIAEEWVVLHRVPQAGWHWGGGVEARVVQGGVRVSLIAAATSRVVYTQTRLC